LSYAIDSLTLYGVYERTKDNLGSILSPATGPDYFGHKSFYLAGKYVFGKNAVKAAYTRSGDQSHGPDTGAKQWSLGYDHKLSRRTSLFALYTRLANDPGATFNLAPPDGPTGNASASALGAIPSAISAGVRHSF
ncbi:MAG: porin, partial [Gallionella sp.]|nr:porin [Gallionella sp.]